MFGSTFGSFLLVRAWSLSLYCEVVILNLKCIFKAPVTVVVLKNYKS